MSYDLAHGGLGLSIADFNPLTLAQKIQAGADKIESNLQTASGWLATGTQRLSTASASAQDTLNRVGAGVQGASRGGIAAAGTGDASSGLALATLTSGPVLVLGGIVLAMWLFTRHPGKRGW